jgi:hypothetical protein
MVDVGSFRKSRGAKAAGAALLLALGAAGGAGAVQATRPTIEMAPTVQTPISKLAATSDVVTVKGRVAEVFGDHFVVQDASGRAMIAAGREARGTLNVGEPVMVQGRFNDGQLHASYLVDRNGAIAAVGARGRRPAGPEGLDPHGPGRDGPQPPPPGCAPVPGVPGGPGAVPPRNMPSPNGVAPNASETMPPPSARPQE